MMKILLPLILLVIGTGGGAAVATFLVPPPAESVYAATTGDCPAPAMEEGAAAADAGYGASSAVDDYGNPVGGPEYVRLNNQFVVPVVSGDRVAALVILSISVEVSPGTQETILLHEPKLRDAFLQILFDHANIGGFDGNFTSTRNLAQLRAALREAARQAVGRDALDVLILDLVRQDVPA